MPDTTTTMFADRIRETATENGWTVRVLHPTWHPNDLLVTRGAVEVVVYFAPNGRISEAARREHGEVVDIVNHGPRVRVVLVWLHAAVVLPRALVVELQDDTRAAHARGMVAAPALSAVVMREAEGLPVGTAYFTAVATTWADAYRVEVDREATAALDELAPAVVEARAARAAIGTPFVDQLRGDGATNADLAAIAGLPIELVDAIYPPDSDTAALVAATDGLMHELTPDGPACGAEAGDGRPWLMLDTDPEKVTCPACKTGQPANEVDDVQPPAVGPDGSLYVSPEVAGALAHIGELVDQVADRSGDYLATLEEIGPLLSLLASGRWGAGTREPGSTS